ncbi:hypothetical protein, partial [Paraburkholderia kirstenboschensis]|uniref:hypothetical protein n=1 Tax=Paraburkholderia kirstenboschensis TaxID=1245436 RepID=UPI001FB5446B
MKTAPSSPAPVMPAANGAWAARLVVFSARPKTKQRPSNDITLTSSNPRGNGRNSDARLTCLNDWCNRRSVAPDGVKTVTSRQFFYGRPPPTVGPPAARLSLRVVTRT